MGGKKKKKKKILGSSGANEGAVNRRGDAVVAPLILCLR